jgi:hypothetical protein
MHERYVAQAKAIADAVAKQKDADDKARAAPPQASTTMVPVPSPRASRSWVPVHGDSAGRSGGRST